MRRSARAKAFLQKLEDERTPIISKEMFARVDEIAKDPKRSKEFLQKGGFLDANGKLAAKYGG